MPEYLGTDIQRDSRSVLTVGAFDGVHRGHLTVLSEVTERAKRTHGVATVVTFDPHPREVITGENVPLLTTVPERIGLLRSAGIERTVIIPFDETFSSLAADAFVRDVLFGRIGMREVVVGHDHAFGKGRSGDLTLLQDLGEELGFRVAALPAATNEQTVISSSMIRELLLVQGDVEKASECLGRYHMVSGEVVRGDGRGKTIGFPTANIAVAGARKIIPRHGVYAVCIQIGSDAAKHPGMMNVGVRPTFDGVRERVEVHVIGFDGDLYGRSLQLEFVKRIRDERKFDGIDALREQLIKDKARCIEVLAAVS